MPVSSSPVPLGEKGHYAFVFPIRPGETRFQVSYCLPYNGSYRFSQRLSLSAQNFAVMLPKSMTLTPGAGAPFQPVNYDVNAQTFLARNVSAAQPLEFTVSGSGQMPREQAQGAEKGGTGPEQAGDTANASAATDTRPGGGLGNPIDTPDPLTKYRWWILGGLSLLLAGAAAFPAQQAYRGRSIAASPGAFNPHAGGRGSGFVERTGRTGRTAGSTRGQAFRA